MGRIEEEQLGRICELACLKLNDEERRRAVGDMEKILSMMEVWKHIPRMAAEENEENQWAALREDTVEQFADRDELIQSSPNMCDSFYVVPRTFS